MASNSKKKARKTGTNKLNGTTSRKQALQQKAKRTMKRPVVSNDGTKAIDSKNTLSNIGNFIGKAAGIASKFLPGVGGMVASGISDLLNDPEWWESIPGQQLTCNEPLGNVTLGNMELSGTGYRYDIGANNELFHNRPVYGEFVTTDDISSSPRAIVITDDTMTQYVIPAIRKVINAVPLQSATAYKDVLSANITLYALFKILEKYDFLMKNGRTYLPDMNVSLFPMLQVDNYAKFTSIKNRIREYLSANVRIPHTMCEYLAWRFGRIYKAIDSEKSALIFYDLFPLHNTSISDISNYADSLMAFPSSTEERQKALSDLYLVYNGHVQSVMVDDNTQYSYDKKEFMLRCNLDILALRAPKFSMGMSGGLDANGEFLIHVNPVTIDSHLDNKTVFMASTVSTRAQGYNTLFPVNYAYCCRRGEQYVYTVEPEVSQDGFSINALTSLLIPVVPKGMIQHELLATGVLPASYSDPEWTTILTDTDSYGAFLSNLTEAIEAGFAQFIGAALYSMADMKALDLYNVPVLVCKQSQTDTYSGMLDQMTIHDTSMVDISASTMDLGTVTETVLENEQVYAAANLLHSRRTRSTTKSEAEVAVADDLVETLSDIDIIA